VTLYIPINGTSIAIAPDGSRIAFIGTRQGANSLFIHTLATGTTMPVPDTRDAVNPMFFADSQWVAFGTVNTIKKVPASGGPVQVMTAGGGGPLTWLSDGRMVGGSASGRGIQEYLPEQRPLTTLAEGEEGHLTPLALADGSLLFTGLRGGILSTLNSINVWRPGATKAQEVVPHASSPQLLGRDAIVFAQGQALFAAGFDSRAIRLTGEPRAMGIQVQTTAYSAAPMYAVAENGTLVYAERPGGRRLVWVDRAGREEFVKAGERMYSHLRLSPDGSRVAVYALDDDRDLWVIALNGSFVHKLSSGPARDVMPVWSPKGDEIFFTTAERNINRVPADASAPAHMFFPLPGPDRLHPVSITPDGKSLLMQWDIMPKRIELRLLDLGANPQLTPLLGDSGTESGGRLSPNGRWLVYQSTETTGGRDGEIMVRPFPDVRTRRWVVSTGIGRQPVWSHDGREIFYLAEDGTVMSLRFSPTDGPYAEPPVRVVTPVNVIRDSGSGPTYDVSPDGQRFLFIKAPELDIRSLNVVLNWDVEVNAVLGRAGR
jgi:Tol biopolymer transport system component